jgi:hypothetical protein
MLKNGLTDKRVDMHRTIYSGEGHALRAFPKTEKTGSARHTGTIKQREDKKLLAVDGHWSSSKQRLGGNQPPVASR